MSVFLVRNVTVRLVDDPAVGLATELNVAAIGGLATLAVSLISLAVRKTRDRRSAFNAEAALDTGLIVSGGVACILTMFTLPAFEADSVAPLDVLSTTVFPLMDTAVAAAVVYVALVTRRDVPAKFLLVACIVLLFLFDMLRAQAVRDGITTTPRLVNIPLVLAYGFIGAFALHPSMRKFGASGDGGQAWGPMRIVVLTAGLLTPIILIAFSPSFKPAYLTVLIAVNIVSTALLLVRSVRAVRAYSEVHSALRVQAERDGLTGLANRPAFRAHVAETLAMAEHSGRTVSVIYLDLDGFKQVNDTFGHQAGDALLVEVGRRMQVALRTDDFPTRLGGDEFALVCLDDEFGTVGERLAERMQALFSEPFDLNGHDAQCGVAVGLANTADLPEFSGDALVGAADAAMYEAKRAGSHTWVRVGDRVANRGPGQSANQTHPAVPPLVQQAPTVQ